MGFSYTEDDVGLSPTSATNNASEAQSGRAADSYSVSCGFKPHQRHQFSQTYLGMSSP